MRNTRDWGLGTGDKGQGTRDRGLVIGCKVQGPGFLKQKECHNQPHEPCSPLLRRGAGGEARNARARYQVLGIRYQVLGIRYQVLGIRY